MDGGWTLLDGGDGFFGLSQDGTVLSEGLITQNNGYTLNYTDTMLSARDRWQFMQVGDGSVEIVNRATGDRLTQVSGCTLSSHENGNANQHWIIASRH